MGVLSSAGGAGWVDWWLVWGVLAVILAALPLVMAIINLPQYPAPPRRVPRERPNDEAGAESQPAVGVSERATLAVCVPARNEAENIEACVRGILTPGADGERDENLLVVVYDDESSDATPEIIARLAAQDSRVHSVPTQPLPGGWNGKMHACWQMGQWVLERHEDAWLVFTDADVRFGPGAARAALRAAYAGGADGKPLGLISTFPRQVTGTLAERVIVPMMFYLLFGYLPFVRMRTTLEPASSAGCGQFLLCSAEAYRASGGHSAFPASMHDGIKLPRAVRKAQHKTGLFDGTGLLSVRMYRGFGQTWRGFAKNAYEGLGSPGLLLFMTIVHLVGHIAPWMVLAAAALGADVALPVVVCAAAAAALTIAQRVLLAARLRHSVLGALLHPIGVTLMTLIQWHSYLLHVSGRRSWRGRTQESDETCAATG